MGASCSVLGTPRHAPPPPTGPRTLPNDGQSSDRPPSSAVPSSAKSLDPNGVPRLRSGWILGIASLDAPEMWAAARQVGAAKCVLIPQGMGETNGVLDEAKLRRSIAQMIGAGWTGLACLDFEGKWLEYVHYPPDSTAYRDGEARLLHLLEIAREVRPEAKWTFYGVPDLLFWVKDDRGAGTTWSGVSTASREEQFARARRSQRIIDACDWITPSIYAPYLPGNKPETMQAQAAYARAKTEIAIEMAKGKPVLPMVWHRVHDSNKTDGLKRLTIEQLMDGQIRPALETGAVGVIWWGADLWMIQTGGLQKRQPAEVPTAVAQDMNKARSWVIQQHLLMLNQLETAMNAVARTP